MKKIIVKNFLILFFFLGNAQAFEDNKIVIKVNEKIITSYEIKNKINTELVLRNLAFNQPNIDKIKNLAVQNLIEIRIKEREIDRYNSISYNNVDISKKLEEISSGNVNKLKEKFLEFNLDYEIFLKELKIQTAWQRVIIRLFQNKVKIDEKEILKEINDLKNERANIKEYNLSEIEITFANLTEQEEKIKDIKKSINKIGFDKTVSIYSESFSATNNGIIGVVNQQSLSEEIYNELKNLNEGDISNPIIQNDKVIFLKINKISNIQNQNFDIEKIKNNLINKKRNNLFGLYSKSYLSKLKNNSYIEFK